MDKKQKCLNLDKGSEMVRRKPDIRRYTIVPRASTTTISRGFEDEDRLYTKMTHSYLLEGNPPSFCEECSTTATIDHIFWTCSVFIAARNRNEMNLDIMKY
jgi:UPF0288 family protein (methanogenesis marker protein 3)